MSLKRSLNHVHQYVGIEPSGSAGHSMHLDKDKKPHNPMINTGTLLTHAMISPEKSIGDRFDAISETLSAAAGRPNQKLAFNNSTFLTERDISDRNYALAYLMKENKCYPKGPADEKFTSSLELYFQTSSIEVNCQDMAHMAATLANGGIAPLTGDRVFEAHSIKHVLSLMLSCGCYDFSGEFAFDIGIPAKSSINGAIMLVIPNLCGICLWSPKTDDRNMSVRGLDFCRHLVNTYSFHNFENVAAGGFEPDQSKVQQRKSTSTRAYKGNSLIENRHKKNLKQQPAHEQRGLKIMQLMFAAQKGDVSSINRLHFLENNMEVKDYDGRTALHIAASEGHYECCEYLLKSCKSSPFSIDRFGKTPRDNAEDFGHKKTLKLIESYMESDKIKKIHRQESQFYDAHKDELRRGEMQVKVINYNEQSQDSNENVYKTEITSIKRLQNNQNTKKDIHEISPESGNASLVLSTESENSLTTDENSNFHPDYQKQDSSSEGSGMEMSAHTEASSDEIDSSEDRKRLMAIRNPRKSNNDYSVFDLRKIS